MDVKLIGMAFGATLAVLLINSYVGLVVPVASSATATS